jgi:c-di-GMP-binding flagellar brake protein YcgR
LDEIIKLSDVVKPGEILKTKQSQSNCWENNLILDINDDCKQIELAMERDNLKYILMVGDTVKCKYYIEDREYILKGWITKIYGGLPLKVKIKIHDIDLFRNQRAYFRYDVYLSSVIKRKNSEENGIFAVMVNISNGGCALALKKDISEEFKLSEKESLNEIYFFEVYIKNDITLVFQGEIVRRIRKSRGIEYGVKFVDLDTKNSIKLEKFIEELENENKELYNSKSSFWTKNSKYFKGD